jgi:metal-responsive CopG/Arc/MetJ family transcriptional regulator
MFRGAPASVESVRLDPELRDELAEYARTGGATTSEIIREALRRFLRASQPDRRDRACMALLDGSSSLRR